MKKCSKLASLFAIGLFAVGVIACNQPTGNKNPDGEPKEPTTQEPEESGAGLEIIPEGFVKVTGKTFDGTETWTPESYVFVSGRAITIRDLIVCDHEVTQGEYEKYCTYGNVNGCSDTYGKGVKFPAYYVNWYDAIVYCNLRSIAENLEPVYKLGEESDPRNWVGINIDEYGKCRGPKGKNTQWDEISMNIEASGYRLPTEAEWEYLARGGETTSTKYSGSDIIVDVAWFGDNSDRKIHEVKTKDKNKFGLYDMSGNVWEWCWDWYTKTIIFDTPETGVEGTKNERCERGGSWNVEVSTCSVSFRYSYEPDEFGVMYTGGFRVVRTAGGK